MGFVAMRRLDEAVFVAMIYVAAVDQGRDVGTDLVRRVITIARGQGSGVVPLVTFRDVSWNWKWYQ